MLAGEELVFQGPYEWIGPTDRTIFGSGWVGHPGVYLWTVPIKGFFVPYYVGSTGKSLGDKFVEHTRAYLSGEYTIWDPAELAQRRKVELWGGLWKPERRGMFPAYAAEFEKLAPRITELLKLYRLFVGSMRGSDRMRERAEAAIIRSVRSQDPKGILDENLKFRPRGPSESPVTYEFRWPGPVEWVPKRDQI